MASQNPERFLRLAAVLDRTGLSRATLYRKIHAGTFPQQVKLAERCCGWRESQHAKIYVCIKNGDYSVIAMANSSNRSIDFSEFISIGYRDLGAEV